jgi:precorrin-6B methylase 1
MEALNKIKIPDHISKVLTENRELIEQHFQVNERLIDEHERVVQSNIRQQKHFRRPVKSKKD